MTKLFTIIAALFIATSVQAGPSADLVIQDRIGNNMKTASAAVAKLADKQDTINILIDSPGGSVYAGWEFIRTMRHAQARGVTFNCYVSGMAASMAFQILSFCDGKYALSYSMLLWHPVRAGSMRGLTPTEARNLAKSLKEMAAQLISELRANIQFESKYFWHHYHQETLHVAEMLEKNVPDIKVVKRIPVINEKTVVAKEAPMFQFKIGILDYMHPTAAKIYYGNERNQ